MNPKGAEQPLPFNLTEVDRQVLAQTDDEFVPHDWDNLKDIIDRNDLGVLKRRPSDLLRYIHWSRETKADYGSITNYICRRRLGWALPDDEPARPGAGAAPTPTSTPAITTPTQATASSTEAAVTTNGIIHTGNVTDGAAAAALQLSPSFACACKTPILFAEPTDYRILRNDWPYGLAPGIDHLVVWLRTPVPVKEVGGDMTDEARGLIEDFIQRTFVDRLARERSAEDADPAQRVLWFKNWTALQSVRALEHIHVLVRDVPERIIYEWTGENPPDP